MLCQIIKSLYQGGVILNEVIRVRTGVAVIQNGQILLVPHYNTDLAPLIWYLPGGGVDYCETVEAAAIREFVEETGFLIQLSHLLDVSEVIIKEKPWHSLTISYYGTITGGQLLGEVNHPFGDKTPRWFDLKDLNQINYHPARAINKAAEWYMTTYTDAK